MSHDNRGKAKMMGNFIEAYFDAFSSIEGYFSKEAALLFMAYNQLIRSAGIAGDVLEIGVHHGLSAIAIASLCGFGGQFVAIDLFEELQAQNTSHSGVGNKATFLRNMQWFFDDISFIRPITSPSADVKPTVLGSRFSFCHIDGGHTARETYSDMTLCYQLLMPGGLVALDDYFNPSFPGVCEGAIQFMLDHRTAFRPIAIGFNKVVFQKRPCDFDLNARFTAVFPKLPKVAVTLWEAPTYHFSSSIAPFFDITRSTPIQLVPNLALTVQGRFEPQCAFLNARIGETTSLPVRVFNTSTALIDFAWPNFGVSYHLLSKGGEMLEFEHRRTYFNRPLAPGENAVVSLPITAPDMAGLYVVEIDMVWEGVTWFKDSGGQTSTLTLTVC
jgi:Methyltransferase domain